MPLEPELITFETAVYVPYAYGGGVLGLNQCSKCKGIVLGDDIEEHRAFHAEIAELREANATKG